MRIPEIEIPVVQIPVPGTVKLFMKREDLIHPEISGNKFWKLFYNISQYQPQHRENPLLITFGGAYSNHIAAVSALGRLAGIPALGIIRGEELEYRWFHNPTLQHAHENEMKFRFVTRAEYRDKETLTLLLQEQFPEALIIPEGGTNEAAVQGVQHMLNEQTKRFDYLCTAVGTGGTVAGLAKFAAAGQRVIGYKTVADQSLEKKVQSLAGTDRFELIDATFGGYGKISDEIIRFINDFDEEYGILMDPVYTGKMMAIIFKQIESGYFPDGSSVLAFHTGGLQGIEGANELLRKQKRQEIKVVKS